jgi:hypothetical protein
MTARRASAVAFAVLLVVTAVAGASALGVVSADHGAEDANYTVEPMSDRSPGATSVKYGQIVVVQAGVDFETLEESKAVYEEGSWASCGAGDAEVFGIDRGNTHDGYETDESLEENTKTFSAGEDVFRVEFYGEEDFGPSTHLNNGDAVVSVAQCIDNPDEPGWYQISGSMTGVTEDGERVTIGGESHYFWICDCEDEAEARETLGPPPSEEGSGSDTDSGSGSDSGSEAGSDTDSGSTSNGTEDAPEETDRETLEDDASSGGGNETDSESGASEAESGSNGTSAAAETEQTTPSDEEGGQSEASVEKASSPATPEETEGDGGAVGGDSAAPSDASASSSNESWESHVVQTPTPGSGDGPGVPAAVAALAVAALLARRL